MKRNRILAIGIALLLAVQLLTPLACAAGTTLKLTAPDKLPDVGQTFTVTAELTGNTGLAAVQLSLGYDDSVVECTGIENGALVAGMLAASNPYATRDGVGAILAAATTTAVKTDGSLAVFTFRVKAAGDAKLTLADALLSDTDGKALPLSYSLPALIAQGSGAAFFDIVQNRTHQIGGFGSTHCSTRHRGKQFGTGQVLTTQVNDSHDVLTHNAPS